MKTYFWSFNYKPNCPEALISMLTSAYNERFTLEEAWNKMGKIMFLADAMGLMVTLVCGIVSFETTFGEDIATASLKRN